MFTYLVLIVALGSSPEDYNYPALDSHTQSEKEWLLGRIMSDSNFDMDKVDRVEKWLDAHPDQINKLARRYREILYQRERIHRSNPNYSSSTIYYPDYIYSFLYTPSSTYWVRPNYHAYYRSNYYSGYRPNYSVHSYSHRR